MQKKKMGDNFDGKEFNTIILETGPCQFDILKEQVDKKSYREVEYKKKSDGIRLL